MPAPADLRYNWIEARLSFLGVSRYARACLRRLVDGRSEVRLRRLFRLAIGAACYRSPTPLNW